MSLRKVYQSILGTESFGLLQAWCEDAKPLNLRLEGALGSSLSFLIAGMGQKEAGLLVVVPSYEVATYLLSDLHQILGAKGASRLLLFSPTDQHPYDKEHLADSERMVQRTEVLQALKDGFKGVVVTSADAVAELVPPMEVVQQNTLILETGDMSGPDFLMELLVEQGFEVVSYVQHAGEVARRGGIVDVYPFVGNFPVRLEFFGDELDTIREFDPSTQRSVSRLTQVRLVPKLGGDLNVQKQVQQVSLWSYLNEYKTIAIDSALIREQADHLFKRAEEAYKRLDDAQKEMVSPPPMRYFTGEQLLKVMQETPSLYAGVFSEATPNVKKVAFKMHPQPDFNGKIHLLKKKIESNALKGWHTLILCDSRGQEIRLKELIDPESITSKEWKDNFDLDEAEARANGKSFSLWVDPLHEGFEIPALNLAVYTDHQIFNRYHRPTFRKQRQRFGGFSLRELVNLNPGDFVTHIDYGIGRYAGLQMIEVRGKQQEVVKLVFRDEDVLYVNVNALHKLHKYTGKEGHQPRLSKLGTQEWERIKTSTKRKVKDIARDLIKLYAERQKAKGHAFPADSIWSKELEASFEFEDTPDQAKSWEEVKADMEKTAPMDRLVCGDVGFGKTEVAVRAAFKAIQDGKQVAVLVPTSILATQHFKTFSERLGQFPVNVGLLSRFNNETEQKETLKKLKEGRLDVVIGTHRLANKNIQIPHLGLLVIDEEQRFGVSVKERLRQMRANVDTLTLTATPIPRTLQFSLMGARDLSYINTPPPNRQPIQTEIHTFNKDVIRDAILYETGRGGQVFFIHNRVQSIEEVATMLRQLVPNVRIQTAHGQMDSDALEKVMMDFMQRKFEVLVSTNIVESGLDISNANTMIINHAERFGLAELHQLRGRVGRSNRKAFCYLIVPSIQGLTKEAKQRLRAIEEFSDLGSGLNIAMRDLDIRGAGNLLGAEQTGFIADVGYETYQRILEEAVLELKQEAFAGELEGEPIAPKALNDTIIDLDLDALIPEYYVEDRVERLNLYRTLSEAKTTVQIQEIRESWADRFGAIPEDAENLLLAMELKLLVEPLRLSKVQFKNERLFLTMPPNADKYFYDHLFKPLLAKVAALPNRYALKDTEGKLRIIIQNVSTLEAAQDLIRKLCTVNESR